MNYNEIIEHHLEKYTNTILKCTKKYISIEIMKLLEIPKDPKWCTNWRMMAMDRTCFLIDWLIRNEIIFKTYIITGHLVEIWMSDSDNRGEKIIPHGPNTRRLYNWFKHLREHLDQKKWLIVPDFAIEDELRKWYRKFRSTELKIQHGFYTPNEGLQKRNLCKNMLRIQYILIAILEEIVEFIDHIDRYLENELVQPTYYTIDYDLLMIYKISREKYKQTTSEIESPEKSIGEEI